MSYEQPDADRVSARMDFLLAPDIAHSFGSAGVALVEQAEGKLENASVSGDNAGAQIELSQTDSAGIEAEAQRIEARLAARGLTAAERAELQRQLGNLRQQLHGNAQTRRDLEKTIATTPVSFAYASEGMIGGDNTFGKAASASWSSLETMISFLTLIAGIALPWLLLIGLIVVIVRSPALRRMLGKTPPAEPQPPL
jgi:VIT1/CCC1 family predicted Fe2+/Mn2+ transporter